MKRILSILLVAGLLLCGCQSGTTTNDPVGSNGDAVQGGFRVGYGRENITPINYDVPLAGYGNTAKRMSAGFMDFIYTTCIAFTDANDNTILLFHNDLIRSSSQITNKAREAITAATGIPGENIMLTATHTHAGPDIDNTAVRSILRYNVELVEHMVKAAETALADRKPAEMYVSSIETEGLNFVRHYLMSDGTYAGDHMGSFDAPLKIVKHTTDADRSLQLVKFVRQGGKDVVLANFQTHPHRYGGGSKHEISADLVGAFRDALEAAMNCNFIYFSGASGNVNPYSKISGETASKDYLEQGKMLAEYAVEAAKSFEKVESGNVQILHSKYTGKVDQSENHKYADALKVQKIWQSTNDGALATNEARKYGINSQYHANGIVNKYTMSQKNPNYTIEEIYAFSIGDVGFALAPYEMFSENGLQIKEGSPFKMTVIATCANDGVGYIPSELFYEMGSYEVNCGIFAKGTGEQLATMYIAMLEKLYETK